MNLKNAHALLIGVGSDLPVTVSDATAIASILKDPNKAAYNKDNVVLLTEQEATRQNVLEALEDLTKKVSLVEDATVIVYYSGHGGIYNDDGDLEGNYYLLTNGYDANRRSETMILGTEFSELLDKIKAKKLLVMLDCCHAAGMLGTKPLMKSVSNDQNITNSNIELLGMLQTGEGRVFISSCDDDEQSVILPGAKNSLFTEVVIDALSGKASTDSDEAYVRVIELLYYVLMQVTKRIKEFNHIQRPIINKADNLSPDYYLCKSGIIEAAETVISYNSVEDLSDKTKSLIDEHNITNSHNTIDINAHYQNVVNQTQIDNEAAIKKIKKRITNGDTKKAITLFLELTEEVFTDQRNDAILSAASYNSLLRQKMNNLISDENYRIQLAKINVGLLFFVDLCD